MPMWGYGWGSGKPAPFGLDSWQPDKYFCLETNGHLGRILTEHGQMVALFSDYAVALIAAKTSYLVTSRTLPEIFEMLRKRYMRNDAVGVCIDPYSENRDLILA